MSAASSASFARLHVECVGGVAGDMLLAALIDLGADVDTLRRSLASLGHAGPGPAGPGARLNIKVDAVTVDGERALHVRSLAEEDVHRADLSPVSLADILTVIDAGEISAAARGRARAIFEIMATAEAAVHGGARSAVHLHEVGALDSIMDVVGIAVALDLLGNPRMTATPIPSGHGTVMTSHGELDVPVPAVVEIATRWNVPLVPADGASARGETVTPTGIAVLAQACDEFVVEAAHTGLRVAVGVGAGTRRFADRPNVVRLHGFK